MGCATLRQPTKSFEVRCAPQQAGQAKRESDVELTN